MRCVLPRVETDAGALRDADATRDGDDGGDHADVDADADVADVDDASDGGDARDGGDANDGGDASDGAVLTGLCLACGALDQDCCEGNRCDYRLRCDLGAPDAPRCVTCGDPGGPCCEGASPCAESGRCVAHDGGAVCVRPDAGGP